MTEPKKKGDRGWVWALAIGGAIIVLALVCMLGIAAGFVVGRLSATGALPWRLPTREAWREIAPELVPTPTVPPVKTPETIPPTKTPRPPELTPPTRTPETERIPEWTIAVLVREVMPGSPAEMASLQVGDVIVAVNGEQLTEDVSLADLISRHKPGDTVTLTLWDRGRTRSVEVQLGKHPDDPERAYLGIRYVQLELPGVFYRGLRPGRSD